MKKSRLEAFSDGVFAIVVTLLILDIRFPEVDYSQFAATLTSVLPRILAYVMSFIIIGLYWVIHHNSMHVMKKTDRGFLWLNNLVFIVRELYSLPHFAGGTLPFRGGTDHDLWRYLDRLQRSRIYHGGVCPLSPPSGNSRVWR